MIIQDCRLENYCHPSVICSNIETDENKYRDLQRILNLENGGSSLVNDKAQIQRLFEIDGIFHEAMHVRTDSIDYLSLVAECDKIIGSIPSILRRYPEKESKSDF